MPVTVVMPAYEAAVFIRPAIESVLAQTHRDIELLVVDDGSTDETAAIVESYARRDERVRLLNQPNRGAAVARNHGVAEAGGQFVAFLDADDEWLPRKLERQLREFTGGQEIAATGCLMEYVSSRGKVLGVSGESTEGRHDEIARAEFMPFSASALVAPTKLVRELGGFDTQIPHAEDFDLVSRLARHGLVITVLEVLARYRVHADSVSARHFFTQRTAMRFLAARVKARDRGQNLTWDEFCRQHPPTLRDRRADLCAYCYRAAGLRVADGHMPSGALYLAASGLLGPRYAVRRLLRQRGLARRDRIETLT